MPERGIMAVVDVARVISVWIGAVFVNFAVTLAMFPSITAQVKSVDAGNVSFCPLCSGHMTAVCGRFCPRCSGHMTAMRGGGGVA